MKHISLFSGIGGFDLAAEWMGWQNIAHCEKERFCQKVLQYHFPNSISYADITKTDFTIHRGNIDIVTGGFPCQPFSVAGKRKGKDDERYLWHEMLRAIREIAPNWVVGENVRGLVNWNGGMVFNEVQTDLEAEGYEVFPFLLPASGVNAPHRRDRIWFVAHSKSIGGRERVGKEIDNNARRKDTEYKSERNDIRNRNKATSGTGISSNADGFRLRDKINRNRKSKKSNKISERRNWENFPTQSPIHNGNDGIPTELDGITFSKWRQESIKAGGNAIVPQVALQIFKAIETFRVKK